MRSVCIATEATGRPLMDVPASGPGQPYMSRIGVAVFDSATEVTCFQAAVVPDGWTPPDRPIFPGRHHAMGLPISAIMGVLGALLRDADEVVGHSLDLHLRVIDAAADRINRTMALPDRRICTMRMAKVAGGFPRYPSLGECWEKFFTIPHFDLGPLENARYVHALHLHLAGRGAAEEAA